MKLKKNHFFFSIGLREESGKQPFHPIKFCCGQYRHGHNLGKPTLHCERRKAVSLKVMAPT